jgi:hypothetical protein
MVTATVAVPFPASVALAGLTAQVGGKASVPLEILQLNTAVPMKPEVEISTMESLLPVVAPDLKFNEEDAGARVNDGAIAVTLTGTGVEVDAP